jgi:hypothetical protein
MHGVRRRHTFGRAVTAVACAAAALVTAAAPASAEVATCGSKAAQNYHAGYLNSGDPYTEGSYAVISTRHGAVCDTDTSNTNFTSQYAMIASHDLAGWAQAGYLRWYGGSIYFFAQQSSGRVLNTKFGTAAVATGTSYHYYNKWQQACLCMENIIERTSYLKSSWNPWTTWATPFSPQFTGEAVYLASDLAGTSTAAANYTAVSGQNNATNAWTPYTCGQLGVINNGTARRSDGKSWHVVSTSCPSFNVYTG